LPRWPRWRGAELVEEHAEMRYRNRVVHSEDPLAPRDVFDAVAGVGKLPIEDSNDVNGVCRE
jgi:hypothetical protein